MNRSLRGAGLLSFAFVLFMLTVQNLAAQENESKLQGGLRQLVRQGQPGTGFRSGLERTENILLCAKRLSACSRSVRILIPFLVEESEEGARSPVRLYRLIYLIEFIGVQVRFAWPRSGNLGFGRRNRNGTFLQKWDTRRLAFLDLTQLILERRDNVKRFDPLLDRFKTTAVDSLCR